VAVALLARISSPGHEHTTIPTRAPNDPSRTSCAVSQQKSLKDQLAGVWTLVSCDSTFPNGTKQPYCGNSNGLLVLDAGGRYAMMTAKRDRPKFTTPNRLEAPAEEFKAAAQGLVAQFGTWSVNDTDKTMTSPDYSAHAGGCGLSY
jgi:Lipocalin-like domain